VTAVHTARHRQGVEGTRDITYPPEGGPLKTVFLVLLASTAAGQTGREQLAATLLEMSDSQRTAELARAGVASVALAQALLAIGDDARLASEYARAVLAFRIAEEVAARAGADREMGQALNGKASSLFRVTELDRAMAAAEESVRFHEARHDPDGLGEAWNTIGSVHFYRGDYREALEALTLARELWTSSSNRRGIGRLLNNLGNTHKALGNLEEAATHYAEALLIFEELGDRRSASVVINRNGVLHFMRGEYPEAVAWLRRGLSMSEELGHREGIAASLDSLGNVYRVQGAYSRALDAFHRGLEIRRAIGDQYAIAESENNIGLAHFSQGDYQLAIDAFKRGLSVSRDAGVEEGLQPEALYNIGAAAWRLGEKERALANFRESLDISKVQGAQIYVAANLDALARAALDRGRTLEAEELFQKSLALREEQKDQAGIVETLNGLASLRLKTGRFEDALSLSLRAIEIAASFDQFESLWEAQTLNGIANRRLGREKAARAVLLDAVSVIERLRGEVAGPAIGRVRFFETKLSPYHELIDIAVASGSAAEALELAERSKARALAEMLQRRPKDISFDMSEEELREERKLKSALRALNERLTSERAKPEPDPRLVQALEAERRARRSAYDALQIALYARHPELQARRAEAAAFRFDEAASVVRDESVAVLEYLVADEATHLFVITHSEGAPKVESFRLDASREWLAEAVRGFRERIASRDLRYRTEARALYDLLLSPAARALAGKALLVLVPDGPLWEAPFQALQDPAGRPLVETATVSYAPSLAVLRENLREPRTNTGPRTLLAMGKADFASAGLARLPDAELQASELGKLYGEERSAVFVGPAATEHRFKNEAPRHRIVHLASHGIFDPASPLYSHVVLSPGGDEAREDGLLEAWELLDLDLDAELVVLSACETGRGHLAPGEGIVGTTWALLVAGSDATVTSQWKVESSSTTALLTKLHEGLARGEGGKASQLRRATLELMKNPGYAHPFYWAPFVLIGNPF
jgi:CHAT domain-containing protein/tetratricopeptide (TPR) repeat protein